ncbi:hypothetical protein AMATHDRAFT_186396 [Amanita thiersii Skay4041]|uniref:Uncharacterized protein n=1 Tax=Amanita thiersii Skay4041 TaxID=703135 RepID=A0A2A9NTT9_9AGAR|nr:hypothetical protein AMATHDRAFT_186396 [Amanita thiersii Skay4041]
MDLSSATHTLSSLPHSLKSDDSNSLWHDLQINARFIADALRVKDPVQDHHTRLGSSSLPTSLTSLLQLALHNSPVPDLAYTASVNELLRVAANLCMDHNDNRGHLLEAGFPQATAALLENYVELLPSPPHTRPFAFAASHLNILRSAIGVLLNSSIGYDPVKDRLNSLETAATVLKLITAVYPPGSWTQSPSNDEETLELWILRATISSWGWRTITELKDVKDETLQILNQDILPFLTPVLRPFCPPFAPESSLPFDQQDSIIPRLLNADFESLEESCTLIESLSLDVEDVRLCLARGFNFSSEHDGIPCLSTMLDFIEHGANPPYWKWLPDMEFKRKKKAFDICKAALIKSVVEVSGEERNEEVLWSDSELDRPGGVFVSRMVEWIKNYHDCPGPDRSIHRDDLVICGTLALANLTRREAVSVALLSPPYSLAPILASKDLLNPTSDINVKHGVIGLLKHIAQTKPGSIAIASALVEVNILQRIVECRIWEDELHPMTGIVQLGAIGLAKHLCNSNLDHTLAMFQSPPGQTETGLMQILNLVKRTDNVPIKSEGTRVVVNIIKSLWLGDNRNAVSEVTSPTILNGTTDEILEKQTRRQAAIRTILTLDVVEVITNLIARSRRYPLLVNEGVIALSLISTTKDGGPLVLKAITEANGLEPPTPIDALPSASTSEASSPVTTPSSRGGTILPTPHSALEILVFVLRNVDNPVNFPPEVRVNVCSFLVQLNRNNTPEEMIRVKEVMRPVLERLVEGGPHVLVAPGMEDVLKKSIRKVLDSWAP